MEHHGFFFLAFLLLCVSTYKTDAYTIGAHESSTHKTEIHVTDAHKSSVYKLNTHEVYTPKLNLYRAGEYKLDVKTADLYTTESHRDDKKPHKSDEQISDTHKSTVRASDTNKKDAHKSNWHKSNVNEKERHKSDENKSGVQKSNVQNAQKSNVQNAQKSNVHKSNTQKTNVQQSDAQKSDEKEKSRGHKLDYHKLEGHKLDDHKIKGLTTEVHRTEGSTTEDHKFNAHKNDSHKLLGYKSNESTPHAHGNDHDQIYRSHDHDHKSNDHDHYRSHDHEHKSNDHDHYRSHNHEHKSNDHEHIYRSHDHDHNSNDHDPKLQVNVYKSHDHKSDHPRTDTPNTDTYKLDAHRTDGHETDTHKRDAHKTDGHKIDDVKTDKHKLNAHQNSAHKTDAQKINEEQLKKLGLANNHLGLKLFNSLATQSSGENVFFSPLSISTVFGMLYYGTRGDTAKELRRILGYDAAGISDEDIHRTFSYFLTSLEDHQDKYTLNSANSLLVDKRMILSPQFQFDVQNLYQAVVLDVDFEKNSTYIVQQLNEWVKKKTHGKIEKLVDEMKASTSMALLNAIYFKGTWKTKFDSSRNTHENFYNNGMKSQAKKVVVMHLTEKLPYARMDGYQVVELPYKGEDISMVAFVPDEIDGAKSLEKEMSLKTFNAARQQLKKEKVRLSIPKFKMEFGKELSTNMKEIGAEKIFKPGFDFSGISYSDKLTIDEISHKAVLEVNEEGSEAAAGTVALMSKSSGNLDKLPQIVADRPFIITIVDKRSDSILFMGKLNKL